MVTKRYWPIIVVVWLIAASVIEQYMDAYMVKRIRILTSINLFLLFGSVIYAAVRLPGQRKSFGQRIGLLAINCTLFAFAFLLLQPPCCERRPRAIMLDCRNGMLHIYHALQSYADDHGGQLPPNFDHLKKMQYLTPESLYHCPGSSKWNHSGDAGKVAEETPGCTDYVYHPIGKLDAKKKVVILEDKDGNHVKNYKNRLYSDGTVETDFPK